MRNPHKVVRDSFGGQRRLRPWSITHFGGMDAAKLHPVACCAFRPDEGGTVSTSLDLTLAPVNGYMRSNAYVDVIQIFVPYQGIEKLELDTQDDAGVTEMTRRRLMAGEGIGLENEGVISKAAFVHPRSIGGNKRVSKTVRLAYLAAVNHLRKHAYYAATQLTKAETAIQPAVLTANVLDRFNGVLEPEKLIDGAINLTGSLPVSGIERIGTGTGPSGSAYEKRNPDDVRIHAQGNTSQGIQFELPAAGESNIRVDMAGTDEITLRDLMRSNILDQMIRKFAQVIQDDPEHGEEAVERALYGLKVDFDDDCQVLHRQVYELTPAHHRPTDGASINDVSAHFQLSESFATLVPRSELGGQLVTLVSVKPLETLTQQPDPAQTEEWKVVNRVLDETELDFGMLTRADLESGVAAVDEDQPVFWVGHNSHKHDYATRGPNPQQIAAVEMKSSMWIYAIPTSVTPDNVNYPASIDMYPFFNWNGAAAEYTVRQVAAISTSLAKGPNPVEKIQIFADDPTLVQEDS